MLMLLIMLVIPSAATITGKIRSKIKIMSMSETYDR